MTIVNMQLQCHCQVTTYSHERHLAEQVKYSSGNVLATVFPISPLNFSFNSFSAVYITLGVRADLTVALVRCRLMASRRPLKLVGGVAVLVPTYSKALYASVGILSVWKRRRSTSSGLRSSSVIRKIVEAVHRIDIVVQWH